MDDAERAKMARVCRQQAVFASTSEVHSALIELAEFYEGAPPPRSAIDLPERPAEKLE
jgi:hypothetical protein